MATGKARALAAIAAALALSIGVAACGDDDDDGGSGGGSGGDGKGGTIALLLPETKTTRYEEQDRPNFERRVKELCPDCELIYSNANQDPAKQQQQAEAAITQGAKVIVMSSVDVASAGAIVERAKQSDVAVIAYGRLIPDAPIDYYVSIDPFKVGQQQAEVQLDAIEKAGGPANPKVVMINGAPTDSNAKPYKDGAKQVFDERGADVVKSYDTPDWSPDKAQQEMEQSLTALGKEGFDAVYVANDGMAGGAIAALKGGNVDPASKFVTGQDAELAGVQRILAGEQLMTVYQPIIQIAESAAELAVPLAQGKEPPADLASDKVDNGQGEIPSVLLDTIAIQPDNIQSTLIKDGFLDVGEICTSAYADACKEAGLQ
ncbi:MAG TPA: substrate-binding domain-containing protein [Thermoleophilaceae bacterium]|nr:substrate-binding domain-containing protein [Thermoleophilaceae bacterium]